MGRSHTQLRRSLTQLARSHTQSGRSLTQSGAARAQRNLRLTHRSRWLIHFGTSRIQLLGSPTHLSASLTHLSASLIHVSGSHTHVLGSHTHVLGSSSPRGNRDRLLSTARVERTFSEGLSGRRVLHHVGCPAHLTSRRNTDSSSGAGSGRVSSHTIELLYGWKTRPTPRPFTGSLSHAPEFEAHDQH